MAQVHPKDSSSGFRTGGESERGVQPVICDSSYFSADFSYFIDDVNYLSDNNNALGDDVIFRHPLALTRAWVLANAVN